MPKSVSDLFFPYREGSWITHWLQSLICSPRTGNIGCLWDSHYFNPALQSFSIYVDRVCAQEAYLPPSPISSPCTNLLKGKRFFFSDDNTTLYTALPFFNFCLHGFIRGGTDQRQEHDSTPLHNGTCWMQWSLLGQYLRQRRWQENYTALLNN